MNDIDRVLTRDRNGRSLQHTHINRQHVLIYGYCRGFRCTGQRIALLVFLRSHHGVLFLFIRLLYSLSHTVNTRSTLYNSNLVTQPTATVSIERRKASVDDDPDRPFSTCLRPHFTSPTSTRSLCVQCDLDHPYGISHPRFSRYPISQNPSARRFLSYRN